MDIPRESEARRRRWRRSMYGLLAGAAILALTMALSRLGPAAPTLKRATVWTDTVKRGPMVLEVRGLGTLVPEDILWIPVPLDRASVNTIEIVAGLNAGDEVILSDMSQWDGFEKVRLQ